MGIRDYALSTGVSPGSFRSRVIPAMGRNQKRRRPGLGCGFHGAFAPDILTHLARIALVILRKPLRCPARRVSLGYLG